MAAQALFALFVATSTMVNVRAQTNSSFPHVYPNQPTGEYSPTWQKCEHCPFPLILSFLCTQCLIPIDFQVTEQLPNVTWTLPRNWAGNIPVQRAGHDNDTLFFWAFEKENGSLTAAANERLDERWGIWL